MAPIGGVPFQIASTLAIVALEPIFPVVPLYPGEKLVTGTVQASDSSRKPAASENG
jgi:hypothetical protein